MGKHVFDLGWLYILWENYKINIAGNNATQIFLRHTVILRQKHLYGSPTLSVSSVSVFTSLILKYPQRYV